MQDNPEKAGPRYTKPAVERFGTLRQLTLIGPAAGDDIGSVFGLTVGCNQNTGDPDFACRS
jgi:hypothetical protein